MRTRFIIAVLLFALGIGGIMAVYRNKQSLPPMKEKTSLKIESTAFIHDQLIPPRYTCDGEDAAPTITISGVPENAKSLALIMDDPDAPRGTWVHWTMWNIDPKTTEIVSGKAPVGAVQGFALSAVEGMTSFGKPGYGGPCPPSGTHRYFFKPYALDTILELEPSADKAALEEAMTGNVLTSAEIIGLYSRAAYK